MTIVARGAALVDFIPGEYYVLAGEKCCGTAGICVCVLCKFPLLERSVAGCFAFSSVAAHMPPVSSAAFAYLVTVFLWHTS